MFRTVAYSESRNIQNTTKHLSRNILFQTLYNPDIFRTLVYSEFWYILKSKHIQNPAKYLRLDILLTTLCHYGRFRGPIYLKLFHIQYYYLMYQLSFRTTNVLLYPLMKIIYNFQNYDIFKSLTVFRSLSDTLYSVFEK